MLVPQLRPLHILVGASFLISTCLFIKSTRRLHDVSLDIVTPHVRSDFGEMFRMGKQSPRSVNLVVAAMSSEDISWVKEVKIPGMNVVPYLADNTSAPYHAQKNKGHEAMMYHQYFYDFYDNLPEVSILIHSKARAWHVDTLLDQSMITSLNRLDLREVQRRQFLNLRVAWGNSCGREAINTSKTGNNPGHVEEKFMLGAFQANFNLYDVPEILAAPCCSQIAVTREAIRSIPRDQYLHHIQWLLDTPLTDSISGRTWEHMWQYLFLNKTEDCPVEYKAYCSMYHICFGGAEAYDEYVELNRGRERLEDELRKLKKKQEQHQKVREAKEKRPPREVHRKRDVPKTNTPSVPLISAPQNSSQKRDGPKAGAPAKAPPPPAPPLPLPKPKVKDSQMILGKMLEREKTWIEEELGILREAIRIRKEVAIARGAVESHRIAESEDLYNSDTLTASSTAASTNYAKASQSSVQKKS